MYNPENATTSALVREGYRLFSRGPFDDDEIRRKLIMELDAKNYDLDKRVEVTQDLYYQLRDIVEEHWESAAVIRRSRPTIINVIDGINDEIVWQGLQVFKWAVRGLYHDYGELQLANKRVELYPGDEFFLRRQNGLVLRTGYRNVSG